jgi:hypothetical protein
MHRSARWWGVRVFFFSPAAVHRVGVRSMAAAAASGGGGGAGRAGGGGSRPLGAAGGAARAVGVVWFKLSDLRVRDHEPLVEAHRTCDRVAHLLVFDPFWFGPGRVTGFPKAAHWRAKFLLEAADDLRAVRRGAAGNHTWH